MKSAESKDKIYCIFNNRKKDINVQIEKAFQEYLKEEIKNSKNLENK